MTLIFYAECARQTADGEQTIMALAERGRTGCPLQNRVCADEVLGPSFGKLPEATEHVLLGFVLKPHAPVKLDVTGDSLIQHSLPSFGQGCATRWRAAMSTFA
jgi:hypothetical protein